MIPWPHARQKRVRTRVSGEGCSKRAIAVRWEIGNRVAAIAPLPEIVHNREPAIVAQEAGLRQPRRRRSEQHGCKSWRWGPSRESEHFRFRRLPKLRCLRRRFRRIQRKECTCQQFAWLIKHGRRRRAWRRRAQWRRGRGQTKMSKRVTGRNT